MSIELPATSRDCSDITENIVESDIRPELNKHTEVECGNRAPDKAHISSEKYW